MLREVNQAMRAVLKREEAGSQVKQGMKRKYTTSFASENCAPPLDCYQGCGFSASGKHNH